MVGYVSAAVMLEAMALMNGRYTLLYIGGLALGTLQRLRFSSMRQRTST